MMNSYLPEFKHQDIEILQEINAYSGYIPIKEYTLRYRFFEGGWSNVVKRELILRPNAAAVLLYDPEKDQVILIEQLRIGMITNTESPWVLDIVAGLVDSNEAPEQAAMREALEEAASEVQKLIPISTYLVSVGISNEKTFIYCGLTKINPEISRFHGIKEEGEDIRVHIVSTEEALMLLKEGKIMAASAVIALQWLALNRSELRALR